MNEQAGTKVYRKKNPEPSIIAVRHQGGLDSVLKLCAFAYDRRVHFQVNEGSNPDVFIDNQLVEVGNYVWSPFNCENVYVAYSSDFEADYELVVK